MLEPPIDAEKLRSVQAPLKQRYRDEPASARVVMSATGRVLLGQVACAVKSDGGLVVAGLHPAAGGDGSQVCSGDMLLQSLVACSGVTLAAVATAMSIELIAAHVEATAEMDFRGTLGVDRDCPIGLTSLSLHFRLQSAAEDAVLEKLVKLAEKYCVVLQTLTGSARIKSHWSREESR